MGLFVFDEYVIRLDQKLTATYKVRMVFMVSIFLEVSEWVENRT